MTLRIVLDYLRRHWSMYVVAAFPVSVFWIGAAEAVPLSRQLIVAVTLIVAGVIGPAMAAVRFPQREVRLLPVSRRELWLARWLVSVVVPSLWTLVPLVAGCWLATLRLRFGPVGRDTLILAPICVFLYLGVLMAAHGLIDIGREPGGRSRPGATWRAYRLGLGAMPAAGLLGAAGARGKEVKALASR
jgi:hypothetical protein